MDSKLRWCISKIFSFLSTTICPVYTPPILLLLFFTSFLAIITVVFRVVSVSTRFFYKVLTYSLLVFVVIYLSVALLYFSRLIRFVLDLVPDTYVKIDFSFVFYILMLVSVFALPYVYAKCFFRQYNFLKYVSGTCLFNA